MRQRNIDDTMMPVALDIEATILGTCMLDPVVLDMAIDRLRDDDFYTNSRQELFQVMKRMVEAGHRVDLISLESQLKLLHKENLIELMLETADSICTQKNAESHIDILSNLGVMRRLILASNEIQRLCYGYEGEFDAVLEKSESLIYHATLQTQKGNVVDSQQVMSETFSGLERVYKGESIGVTTGYRDLDNEVCGFEPGDLVIIAGRPSMGKTAFCLSMAMEQAIVHRIPVAIFSLEMGRAQLGQRMLSRESRVPIYKMRKRLCSREDFGKMNEVASRISGAPIYMDDEPLLTLSSFRSKLRMMISKYGVRAAYIDYLQLMKFDERYDDNKALGLTTRGLKLTATNFGLPVIVLSQLSRKIDSRTKKARVPMLSDLRGSGSIEQDADVVLFTHREFLYTKNEEDKEKISILIAKQRNGPVGDVTLKFVGGCTSVEEFPEEGEL